MPHTSKKRKKYAVASLGFGLRWHSEDYYLDELAPLGMSRRGFRAWLRALDVPTIEIGNTKFIDSLTFSMALRAISRIGEPDHFTPGCTSLRRGGALKKSVTLRRESFEKNIRYVLAEVIAQRARPYKPTPENVKSAARLAARRMSDAGMANLGAILQRRRAQVLIDRQGVEASSDATP